MNLQLTYCLRVGSRAAWRGRERVDGRGEGSETAGEATVQGAGERQGVNEGQHRFIGGVQTGGLDTRLKSHGD